MNYYLITNASGQTVGGVSFEAAPDPLPSCYTPCTLDQSQNPSLYSVSGGVVVENVAQAQAAQIALLRAACHSAITGGFTSSALGSAYNYPSDPTSQSNLDTVAGSPSGGSLWCESGGVWAMKPHTQSQAQAVLASFVAWLNACQTQLATLTGEVNAATTVSAVQAIAW